METNCCAKCGDYGFFDSGCKNLYCKCHASVEVNCCKQCAGFEVRTHVIGLNHVPMKPACSNISCTCHKENEVNQTNYWREITHTIIKSGDLVGCDFCKKGDTSVKEYPICAPKMDTFIQKVREEAVREEREKNADIVECLKEAIDLMEDVVEGKYKPDSFTTQPWKRFYQPSEK